MNDGIISGLNPVLVESIAIIQECASLAGLRLYWTLLDGHSYKRTHDLLSRAMLTEPNQTARFAELVAAPLTRRLDPRLTIAIEVVNEPEALMASEAIANRDLAVWHGYGVAIRTIADAIRSERPGTLVTSGADRQILSKLWANTSGLDAIDVHIKAGMPLPSRADIMNELAIPAREADSIPLIAGCRGNPAVTANRDDYRAIFQWRLEEDR